MSILPENIAEPIGFSFCAVWQCDTGLKWFEPYLPPETIKKYVDCD